jgi:hypothetical protein
MVPNKGLGLSFVPRPLWKTSASFEDLGLYHRGSNPQKKDETYSRLLEMQKKLETN